MCYLPTRLFINLVSTDVAIGPSALPKTVGATEGRSVHILPGEATGRMEYHLDILKKCLGCHGLFLSEHQCIEVTSSHSCGACQV